MLVRPTSGDEAARYGAPGVDLKTLCAEIHNWEEIRKSSTSPTLLGFRFDGFRHIVDMTEDEHLSKLASEHVCPNCGALIKGDTQVKRGKGAFCSLDCVASYHQAEFAEKARRMAIASRQ